MLIDSGLPVNFWAKAMDTINYLHNHLPTKQDGPTIIPEETWTDVRQNLKHVHIFVSRVNIFIPMQKYPQSEI